MEQLIKQANALIFSRTIPFRNGFRERFPSSH